MSEATAAEPSDRVIAGRYRLLESIGVGRSSTVYRARHLGTHRELAIKLLHADFRRSSVAQRRFDQEARVLGSLHHEHVVEVVASGMHGNDCYLVMPLLPGESLEQRLQREGRLAWDRARALMLQVCSAVAHAHQQGVVHRDLKPANCIVHTMPDGSERVTVVDFGIARLQNPTGGPLTAEGDVVGSPGYIAPEQAESGMVDERTDVYAAGALLFRMLAGRPPFIERGPTLIARLTSEPAPPLGSVVPSFDRPAHIDLVIAQALSRRPENRFQDMPALARALRDGPARGDALDIWLPWCFWVGLPLIALLARWFHH
jgi:serine/threonine protein kinase